MQKIDKKKKWPFKLLDEENHWRLVDMLDDICSASGVPLDMIDKSMADSGCSGAEIAWVKDFHKRPAEGNKGGLLFLGAWKNVKAEPSTRLQAMAAAFIRNFIDARVLHIFHMRDEDEYPDPTVLLLPDFCLSTGGLGKSHAVWRMKQLQSMIRDRFTRRRATVLFVEKDTQLIAEHGEIFRDFLMQNWDVLSCQ